MTIGHPVFLPHPISREIGGVRCKTDYMKVLIATTSSWFSPLPIQIFSVIFQDYQHIVQTAFSKAEMQKILSLSDHEVSALHTSNSESLDDLAFFPICSWSENIQHLFHKSEIGGTGTFKFVLFAFGNNMPPPFTPEFFLHQIPKEP